MSNDIDVIKKDLVYEKDESGGRGLSLSEKLAKGLEEIKIKKDFQKKVFLLDISGSMDSYIDGKSKLEHLRGIMKDYPDARKICFSSDVICNIDNGYVNCNIPERAFGSTNLTWAISYLRRLVKKPERIVLVSDGEPDNEDSAMHEAVQFSVPIDIIFIGQKGSRGEIFMINLAKNTRGKEFTIEDKSNINFQKQLSIKIAGFLTSGD